MVIKMSSLFEKLLLVFTIISVLILSVLIISHLYRKKDDNSSINENISFLSPSIYAFLVRLGIIKTSALSKAFINSLHTLKNTIPSSDYRYAVPWYLVVGLSNSGKTTLLDNLSEFKLPGNDYNNLPENSTCKWFMYTNAIAIEVSSSIFETSFSNKKINNNWQFLAKLLSYYRPRRPLDGIILTIPADILLKDEDYPGANKVIAQNIFENLWWLQSKINTRLPVYTIITKTDSIKGMNELLQNLSLEEKNQIFGWSTPYSLDEAYSHTWIDTAFKSILTSIQNLILKIAANNTYNDAFESTLSFKKNFEKLKTKIQQFTNPIFSPHDRNEGLLFRGLFFTASESVSGLNFNVDDKSVKLSFSSSALSFVRDLFTKKIFVEYNIAQPIFKTEIFNKGKSVIKHSIMYVIIVFLLFGFYFQYSKLQDNFAQLGDEIIDINSSVKKLKTIDSSQKSLLDQELKNILNTISELDTSGIKSIFIPLSWFVDVTDEIKQSISNSFDNAVINSIYFELNLRANYIRRKYESKSYDRFKINTNVLNSEAFKELELYIQKVIALQNVEEKYNSLLEKDRSEYINTITSFLFSKEFNIEKFLRTRRKQNLKLPKFSIELYSEIIRENIKVLFSNFIKYCLSDTYEKIFNNLEINIKNLLSELQDINNNIYAPDIKKLLKKVETIIKFISSENNSWFSNNNFNPGNKFLELMEQLSTIKAIDSKFISSLQGFADENLILFKNRLLKYQTSLTGTFLKNTKIKVEMYPSNNFIEFYKNLETLSKETFMLNIPNRDIINDIPNSKLLIWNEDIINNINDLITEFNNFKNTKIKSMKIENAQVYKEIAKRVLRNNIINMIAKAENFDDMNLSSNKDIKLGLIKNSIRNLSAIKTKLLSIIEFLDSEFSTHKNMVFNLLKNYYGRILIETDTIFEKNQPYDIKFNSINTWDGVSNVSMLVFNAANESEIMDYLKIQNHSLKVFTKDIIEPILDLLDYKALRLPNEYQFTVSKWKELISYMNDYLEKKPGNSIVMLENFLTNYLSKVTLENFKQKDINSKFELITRDFFLYKRSRIASALKARINELSQEKYITIYNQIADLFNTKLAGTFPFVKLSNYYTEDALIDDVENFIQQFNNFITPEMIEFLKKKQKSSPKIGINEALTFLNQISKLKDLLVTIIGSAKKVYNNKNKIILSAIFKANPREEIGGSQILDTKISVGNSYISYLESPNKTIEWYSGDEINCSFQWASNGYTIPYGKSNYVLSVNGNNAKFTYKGKWALLRLLQDAGYTHESFPGNGSLLKFLIPTIDKKTGRFKQTAKLFIRLKINLDIANKLESLSLVNFPYFAPKILDKF